MQATQVCKCVKIASMCTFTCTNKTYKMLLREVAAAQSTPHVQNKNEFRVLQPDKHLPEKA